MVDGPFLHMAGRHQQGTFYAVILPSLRKLQACFDQALDEHHGGGNQLAMEPYGKKKLGEDFRLWKVDFDQEDECGICLEPCTKMVLPNSLLECLLPTAILPFEIHRSRFSPAVGGSESGSPTAMAGCAVEGGCPSDYIAIAISGLSVVVLLSRSILPFVVHKVSRKKGSGFWIPMIQVLASINLVISIVMSVNYLRFKKRHPWQSCYIWAVWIEGPLGFGLLLSCRIVQAFQLYFIFGKKRLPPLRSHISLPLFLLPWFALAALIHMREPLNDHCHMKAQWVVPVICLHAVFVGILVAFTAAIRHIEFRFNELRDLWRGILVAASSICVWITSYVLNRVHEEIGWLQVLSRFLLLVTTGVLIVVVVSISSSQPLLSQISLRRRESMRCKTMGQVLGIPDSGLISHNEANPAVNPNEPLEKLLLDKRFRQSFMAFADSCLAGESMHFYEDIHELGKIPPDDSIRRIYMAREIIDKYILAGSVMEVNISHRCRQEILTTPDMAHPLLFDNALNELLQLMKMNLARDYWSSIFFLKFKEETSKGPAGHELEQVSDCSFSPRLSSIHGFDDPFRHEHLSEL
ncbi:hypothetical protein SAY86_016738 [Trapa natans]|uniref:RGS domain-containing protein n=1 Tax=Trapa natans TaxID=22666 RepID=A0AAN7LR02_TRANT|nr:hypothetical protein SAY86_016738 [Trapa natans]